MSLIIKENKSENYPTVPLGMSNARCISVIDLGTQENDWQGDITWKKQVFIAWETPEHKNDKGEPLTIGKYYNLSMHEKSNLSQDLVSWRGKPFSLTEKQGFDIAKLLGTPCQINVMEKDNGKRKVSNVMPTKDELPKQHHSSTMFSLEEYQKGELAVFNQLSERMRNKILESRELSGQDATPNNESTDQNESDGNVPF